MKLYACDGIDHLHCGREASHAQLVSAVRAAVESGTIKGKVVGWCPRGGGHWDMPESLDDAGDFGVCGSKWTRRFLLIPVDGGEG